MVLIVLNGAVVNQVRLKRWALAKQLRAHARDWTVLPNAGREAGAGQGEASVRWRMRETEGSWWLSYRPVIKVELVTPCRSGASPAVAVAPAVEVEVREPVGERREATAAVPGDHELPGYEA